MPRQSRRSAPAPARSAPAPSRSAPAPAQRAAPVPAQQHHQSNVPATVPQSQGPGIMGSIAANAASVAIGSTMARGLSSALGFGGGYHEAPAPAAEAPQGVASSGYDQSFQQQQQQGQAGSCESIAKDFAKCLSATGNDVAPCQYYLDQFKACQAAAAPY